MSARHRLDQVPHISPAADAWLDTEYLAIRRGVEITEGINHQLIAFDAGTGHYTRLSRSGAAILKALDGTMTGRELAARVVRPGADPESTEHIIVLFLGELRAAGLLNIPPAADDRHSQVRFARRSHMPHRALVGPRVSRLLDPVAAVLRRAPRVFALLWCAAVLLSLAAVWFAVSAPGAAERLSVSGLTWGWSVLIGTMLVQTAVHELSHAVACRYYDVPVREIGIGLLFYVVPAAYVDRTDAYRLTSRRARVVIALAGVSVDVLWLGGHALVAGHAGGQVGHAFGLLVFVQTALLVANLNPLLPTDGYHALEAGLGAVNLRARSFTALRCLVLRQPPPSWLATRSPAQRARYRMLGVICLAYALLIAGLCLRSLVVLVG
ncbi:PqqD family peptide modification chaperone [Streptomyces sp. ISL-10]|uniref:PqqD family peptide modification chaperone n=1 Tax=Streptomyces sp. ISL-10 TaxID=2819172 RepID=UPI001BEA6D61|nr:PqqD family peptide modification chaperone [Streptomyces sp. ISL-10]MBT2365429.1 PqqD family peptide modification chaperone [Streptomyces sp. ISL-10]